MPPDEVFRQRLAARNRRGLFSRILFYASVFTALLVLVILFLNVLNETFGTVAVQYEIPPETLTTAVTSLDELEKGDLVAILDEHVGRRFRVILRNALSQVPDEQYTTAPLRDVFNGKIFPAELGNHVIGDLEQHQLASILQSNLSQSQLRDLVMREVVVEEVVASWPLYDTLFNKDEIEAVTAEEYPEATLRFKSWINRDFLTTPMSSVPELAGIRTAILGTVYVILIVLAVSLPLGVGAAIYLEEYADDSRINRMIETNIRNLAGVPSIIYGMLGLAIFVRLLAALTSGAVFGVEDSNGRTIVSAALTLALLILPIIIINAQEALRAVPSTLREASFGLGATQWQTIWHTVLPSAIPGILTGTILAVSRAIGETAPLIVVGASTFIVTDPDGPFSKFTVLPIQIFQWTSRPEAEFRDIAAAAIIVLLLLMLAMNATAIILRNRYSVRY
ncbi:MAG: phosphate ABC transporter permease PstA [Chloroflexi bacterium]|nr:MAG: phosphate ABC transporter permease PstA [Chloroflexota bacterium]